MREARRRTVAGRAHIHEEQRIFLTHRVGAENFGEEFVGVIELRSKFVAKFFVHLVTAGMNARTDRGANIGRISCKFASHYANSLLYDSCQRAAPAGMKRADSLVSC